MCIYIYIYTYILKRCRNERNEIEAFPKRSSKRLDSCEITVRYAIPERIPIAGHVAANDLTTAWHAMGVDAAGDSKMKM